MNEEVNQVLRRAKAPFANVSIPDFTCHAAMSRDHFYNTTLSNIIPLEELTDAPTCCICQSSLVPTPEDPYPSEHPVRLPCNHVIGQTCAQAWFNTLWDGVWEVPEELNATCPICRTQVVEISELDEWTEVNQSCWLELETDIHDFMDSLQVLTTEQALNAINDKGGFETILDSMDRLMITRWWVFRRFIQDSPTMDYDADLVHQCWEISSSTSPKEDWVAKFIERAPPGLLDDIAGNGNFDEHFERELRRSRDSPVLIEVDLATRWEAGHALKTLLEFTNKRMLPSSLWQVALEQYRRLLDGVATTVEMGLVKIELLDYVSWAFSLDQEESEDDNEGDDSQEEEDEDVEEVDEDEYEDYVQEDEDVWMDAPEWSSQGDIERVLGNGDDGTQVRPEDWLDDTDWVE